MEPGSNMPHMSDGDSHGVTRSGFKDTSSDSVTSPMRRALASSLTSLRKPATTPGATRFAAEVAYSATALDVLENMLVNARANAPLQIVSVELADVLMQLMATLKTST